jgi:CheY-like chemotaxis protein
MLEQLRDKILDVMRRCPAGPQPASATPLPGPDGLGPGLSVLVAEDNAIAAKVINAFLTKLGHRVTLSKNGEECLEQVRAQRFDIAFIDLRMPKLDGLELTRIYRAEEQEGQRLPIIALTANAAEDMRQESREAGMDDFLTKPVDPEELNDIIRRYRPLAVAPAVS